MGIKIVKRARGFLRTFNRTDDEDPMKVFRYQIEIENFSRFGFSKMTGLKATTAKTNYREGGKNTTPTKSPGLTDFADITFSRGQILQAGLGDPDILNWYTQVFNISAKKGGSSKTFRRQLDVVQFDKEGTERKRWRVVEAWPSEHNPVGEGFDAASSDNVIETMVVTHEGYRLVSSART
jgi:phage tail-like protein